MICLQNHPKVDQKMTSWRHNRDVKINIMTFILYEKIFASTKSAIFP